MIANFSWAGTPGTKDKTATINNFHNTPPIFRLLLTEINHCSPSYRLIEQITLLELWVGEGGHQVCLPICSAFVCLAWASTQSGAHYHITSDILRHKAGLPYLCRVVCFLKSGQCSMFVGWQARLEWGTTSTGHPLLDWATPTDIQQRLHSWRFKVQCHSSFHHKNLFWLLQTHHHCSTISGHGITSQLFHK